ncbi:unnamed protein product, partial [Discosporangium mesarthrocarpum]
DRFGLKRGQGFGKVLNRHGLIFEGRPHRGIDDARNIVRMLPVILESQEERQNWQKIFRFTSS